MATAFIADKGAASYPVYTGEGNELSCIWSTYAITTAPIINDTFKMVKIPRGATVTRVRMVSDDLDTSTTLTWDVGDSGSATRYLAASTIGQAGGAAESALAPYTYTADDYISVLCHAAPTSTAINTGNISIVVEYVNP